jgi:hypothetical protein
MPRKRCLVTLGMAVLLVVPSLILAFSPLDPDEAASATPIRVAPELNVHPSLIRYEQGARDAWDLPGTREFFSKYSSDWDVTWDTRSDLPHMISGRGIPMVPGNGNDLEWNYEPSLAQVEGLVRAFMDDNKALFGLPQSDLILRQAGSGNFGRNNQLWFIELQQHFNGIPVEGAAVFFRINNGNLIQFGNDKVAPVNLDTRSSLSATDAIMMSLEALDRDAGELAEVLTDGVLKIFPVLLPGETPGNLFQGTEGNGYNHILARECVFRVAGDDATYRAVVDVHRRSVIDLLDINRTTDVQGGIYPTGPLDAEVTRLFQQVTVSGGCTQLNGVYTRINDNCGSINVCDADDGSADNVIDLGMSGGTDCTTPGYGGAGNTHSARTGHYHLTNLQRVLEREHGQLLPLGRRLRQHR